MDSPVYLKTVSEWTLRYSELYKHKFWTNDSTGDRFWVDEDLPYGWFQCRMVIQGHLDMPPPSTKKRVPGVFQNIFNSDVAVKIEEIPHYEVYSKVNKLEKENAELKKAFLDLRDVVVKYQNKDVNPCKTIVDYFVTQNKTFYWDPSNGDFDPPLESDGQLPSWATDYKVGIESCLSAARRNQHCVAVSFNNKTQLGKLHFNVHSCGWLANFNIEHMVTKSGGKSCCDHNDFTLYIKR
jgi:hypothetical protein